MRGDPRRHDGRRSIKEVAISGSLLFTGLTLFVVAAAIVAGLYVGVHR
jgi:hypothetical protein